MASQRENLQIEKIKRLEKRIEDLMISRRILMSLLEKVVQERTQLEVQNKKLQRNNARYARTILEKNTEIIRLRAQVKKEYF